MDELGVVVVMLISCMHACASECCKVVFAGWCMHVAREGWGVYGVGGACAWGDVVGACCDVHVCVLNSLMEGAHICT